MKQKIKFLLAAIMMLVGITAQAATRMVTWNDSDISVDYILSFGGSDLMDGIWGMGNGVTIVFTIEEPDAATKYNLTLADGSDAHGTVAFTVDGAAATQAKKDDVVTVSVTPATGYSTKDVTVRACTTWAAGAPALGMNRVAQPTKGIYVKNGKKVIVK